VIISIDDLRNFRRSAIVEAEHASQQALSDAFVSARQPTPSLALVRGQPLVFAAEGGGIGPR